MKNILHISPDFNYSCGVSKLIFLTLSYFDDKTDFQNHFITNGGDSLERLTQIKNLKSKKIKFARGIKNIFHYNLFKNEIKNYCLNNGINLIHTYHRFPELVSTRIAKELNIKIVTSALSFVKGYKNLSFQSDKIICEVDYIKNMLVNDFKISPGKIEKMYLPAEEYKPLKEDEKQKLKILYNINENQKILLFIGKISFKKGCDTLIEAFKIVHKKDKDALLLMCGEIIDNSFQKYSGENEIPVKFVEPSNDYYKLYQIADMIILPSRVEPFPFVMIESGSNKKAFIGGDTGGIKEFIEDGVEGLLVDPENEKELADRILYLLDYKDIAEKLGTSLYKKVKEKCDYQDYFNKVEEIYNSLLYSE